MFEWGTHDFLEEEVTAAAIVREAKQLDAVAARAAEIPWEDGAYTGVAQLGQDTEATPLDVPVHPGAARWYREHGFPVYEG